MKVVFTKKTNIFRFDFIQSSMQWPNVGNAAVQTCLKNYFCIDYFKPYFIVYPSGSSYCKISLKLMKLNSFNTHTERPMNVMIRRCADVGPTSDKVIAIIVL